MQPVLEIKQGRVGYLLAALAAAFLGFVFFDIGINHAALSSRYLNGIKAIDKESGMQFLPYMVLVMTIPLTIIFTYNAIKNPVIFAVYHDGLLANTNGISTGLVPWNRITSLEEVSMTVRRSAGFREEAVLAIYVQDDPAVSNAYSSLTRLLKKIATQLGRLNPNQTVMNKESQGFPILIPISTFGKQYADVIRCIEQQSNLRIQTANAPLKAA